MRTCSQKNIEENLRRTEAGFHPECEPTDIDAQSPLAFNLKTGINQAYQFKFARLLSLG